MKKILIVTDISLSKDYHAGNKNALLSLCEYFYYHGSYEVEILNFHFSRPEKKLLNKFNIYHYPDIINLMYRKIFQILNFNLKLSSYKKSIFRKFILKFLFKKKYDLIIIEYLENHHLINECKKLSPTIICDLHDIMYLRRESFLSTTGIPKSENLNITLHDEINLINKFDAVLAIEKSEKEFLMNNNVIPTIIHCKRTLFKNNNLSIITPSLSVFKIGFIGSAAEFNFSTISYFIENIWNKYLYNKNITLILAGEICRAVIEKKINIYGSYEILGRVSDISEFYSAIHLSINPVLSGSGFKTKNAESLSFGVPIVTSENGIKGFEKIDKDYCKLVTSDNNINEWYDHLNDIYNNYKNNHKLKLECLNNFNFNFNTEDNFQELEGYLK
ncbi:TPA: glycosyltransferase family 4 protein [Providencia rettgeri]|nr:glycosyltransferase family 4 protein [Providencia rettgeri]